MKKNSFYVHSLGCKVNAYECSAIKSKLINAGYVLNSEDPEIIIINTCSVTSTADQKSRQHIRSFKNNHPDSIIVVMGCYAQKAHKFIYDDLKADIIVGNSNKDKLFDLIETYKKDRIRIDLTQDNTSKFDYEEICQTAYSENVRAYLKIQDGCDNFCSYCIIPYLRGRVRSRSFQQILKEANEIVRQGFKEIVLTGIHVGGYGKDLKEYSFYDVVDALTNIDGLKRLTISSIEASEIDDRLIKLYKTKDNLAHHIHIPLQSGSETILKLMNRHYDKDKFLEKITKLKKECKDIAITTDVIVGFPGETDDLFNETYEFIKKAGFAQLHVFPYSIREGTKASKMDGQVLPEIKKQRAKKLRELSDEWYEKFLKENEGKTLDVLIESYDDDKKTVKGHTSNYINLTIPGSKDMVNTIIKVKI